MKPIVTFKAIFNLFEIRVDDGKRRGIVNPLVISKLAYEKVFVELNDDEDCTIGHWNFWFKIRNYNIIKPL